MPKEERKKGTHLTWDDRHEIQKGLKEHRTFKEIAYIIGCSPDTVSKEIRRHRYHKLQKQGWHTSMQVPTGVNTEIAAGVGMCVKEEGT